MADRTTSARIARAARALLDQHGEEAVTMRRVAGAVGITPMAVYRHYANRDALLNALANDGFHDLAERLKTARYAGSIEKRLNKLLDVNLDFALENPRLFELMFLRPRAGARQYPGDFRAGKSPTANVMAGLVQQGMESGLFRRGDAWAIVFESGALLQGLVILYLGGRVDMSEKRFRAFAHQSFRRYLHGIRK